MLVSSITLLALTEKEIISSDVRATAERVVLFIRLSPYVAAATDVSALKVSSAYDSAPSVGPT